MAYDQHSGQYYDQARPAPRGGPRQQPAYNQAYDSYDSYNQPQDGYGYDYGYDNGYDNGYQQGYAQPPLQARGPPNMNGQQRPPPQGRGGGWDNAAGHGAGRRPPPQDYAYDAGPPPRHPGRGNPQHAPGAGYTEAMRGYPQGRPPMGAPPGGREPMRQGHHGAGDPRGAGARQQPPQKRAPRDRILRPESPKTLPQDNPFPSFPTTKPRSGSKESQTGRIDSAMANMSIQDKRSRQDSDASESRQRPSTSSSKRSQRSNEQQQYGSNGYGEQHDYPHGSYQQGPGRGQMSPSANQSQDYHGPRQPPMRSASARPDHGPQGRGYNPPPNGPISPTSVNFSRNIQRAMTMPQESPYDSRNRGYQQQGAQWAEPGPAAGYHGPESPSYIPQRPSTTSPNHDPQRGFTGSQPQQYDAPRQQPAQQLSEAVQSKQPGHDRQTSLGDFYDTYYGSSPESPQLTRTLTTREAEIEAEMPNFDAIPTTGPQGHRRGNTIDYHLATEPPIPAAPPNPTVPQQHAEPQPPAQNGNFYMQANKARSQPDLRRGNTQGNGNVFEMPGDIPAVPPMPRNAASAGPAAGPYGQPAQRGYPPNGSPNASGRGQGYPPQMSPPQGYPNGASQRPGQQRNFSDPNQWSEPGPGYSPVQGRGQGPPSGQAPYGGAYEAQAGMRPARQSNPDALPQHATPIRPGLMENASTPQPAKPPPIRQYNSDPSPVQDGNAPPPTASDRPSSARDSAHPVTHDELNRLRVVMRDNPTDYKTGLHLAKRLVEAGSVLADENGTADTKTRNKNREKFVMEAYKLVKKGVGANYPEAMFYLADCYGQGQLGLQIDPKEAFNLYQSAAKLGHGPSAYRTAVCCEMGADEGGGTRKDPLKAVQWYKRAAALGDTAAMYKMGMISLKGLLGQPSNLGEAINWLKRAAERADAENPHALHELALLYLDPPNAERVLRDDAYAFALFRQAAELGYKFSQFRLGQAFEYGLFGCPIEPRNSIAWYSRAAAQEEHQAELALSGWYLTGAQGILEQSDTEAYLWARKAACADPPLPKAMFAMGYFTEVGIGCPRSLDEAKRWYGRAAAYKFPKAQERLEELKKGGVKVQKSRERLSRTNQKQHEADQCVVM